MRLARPDCPGVMLAHEFRTVYVIILFAMLSDLAFYGTEIPLLLLAERTICTHHYAGDTPSLSLAQRDCKVSTVQNKLALFMGYKLALDSLPALLTSLWYGKLANSYGRKPILAIACTGELLNLSWVALICFQTSRYGLELAYLGSAFLLLGGGRFLLGSLFYTVIADTVGTQPRGQYLSILHAVRQVVTLGAIPLGGLLAKVHLLLPIVVFVSVQLLRYPLLLFMTETRPGLATYDSDPPASRNEDAQTAQQSLLLGGDRDCSTSRASVWSMLREILARTELYYCLLCYFVKRIAYESERIVFQYMSEVLHIGLEDASWAQIPLGIGATTATLLILPWFLRGARRRQQNILRVYLRYARISLGIVIVGFLTFWLSTTVPFMGLTLTICGFGDGLEPMVQGLASALVSASLHSMLFTLMGLLDTLAKLFGGPIISYAYAVRDPNGRTYGLCFPLSAFLFTVLLSCSWTMNVRRLG